MNSLKIFILIVLMFITVSINSTDYNYKLSQEYANLSLIEDIVKWHSNDRKIVMAMKIRQYEVKQKIEELWKNQR